MFTVMVAAVGEVITSNKDNGDVDSDSNSGRICIHKQ